MPEIAEVRLMADFINESAVSPCIKITKSEIHKGPELKLSDIGTKSASLYAMSRGKELIIQVHYPVNVSKAIRFNLGMSGNFECTSENNLPKHAHLRFHLNNGEVISFVDARRFGSWRWADEWSPGRGPDIFFQPEEFKARVIEILGQAKLTAQPTHEMLMHQGYFNGIGNYLRAEILYHMQINPFQSIEDTIVNNIEELVSTTQKMCEKAYNKGGGKILTWKNPDGTEAKMQKFFQCYKVKGMESIIDRGGRRFWFDPKWKSSAPKKD